MQSDDLFRLGFDNATARLAAWAERLGDAATVQTENLGQYWRLSLVPHAANACPVELILHRDTQSFDIQLGQEAFEGHRVEAFQLLEDILMSVVAGHVVTQQLCSPGSGSLLAVETRVSLATGEAWSGLRLTDIGAQRPTHDAIIRARHWVPYRR